MKASLVTTGCTDLMEGEIDIRALVGLLRMRLDTLQCTARHSEISIEGAAPATKLLTPPYALSTLSRNSLATAHHLDRAA